MGEKRTNLEKHTVPCPYCGKAVLDHMTECPYCKKPLTPRGYQPMDERTFKKRRLISFIVGAIATVAIIVVILVTKS